MLFLNHPPTITAGTNSFANNLLFPSKSLQLMGIEYHSIQRGGDHTAHEPGQIVMYLHLDLKERSLSIGDFLANMQNICIDTIQSLWRITLVAKKNNPGLYWKDEPSKKIVSIGVYFKSYFTSFGIAINYMNSMNVFQYINPCGIPSDEMISLASLGVPKNQEHRFSRFYSEVWIDILTKKYPGNKYHSYRWL